jgi:hypothetical protein
MLLCSMTEGSGPETELEMSIRDQDQPRVQRAAMQVGSDVTKVQDISKLLD